MELIAPMSLPEPGCFTLRPGERLKRPEDFKRVYEHRRSVSDARKSPI